MIVLLLIVPAQQVRLCVDGAMVWIIKHPHVSQITLDPTRAKLQCHSSFNVHAVHVRTYTYMCVLKPP